MSQYTYSIADPLVDEKEAWESASKSFAVSDFVIPGVEFEGWAQDEYLFVLEFMESMGMKYAPKVLKFEGQHPELKLDRVALCKRYNLDERSSVPLIVQLFGERLNAIQH